MHHEGTCGFTITFLDTHISAGSITYLHFPSRSHLISASEDGTLCLFHARDWTVLRSLKGHKGRVNSVAVHPSGKVALSVGKDKMLRMWDLMRGKGSASTKLGRGKLSACMLSRLLNPGSRSRNCAVVCNWISLCRSIPVFYRHVFNSEFLRLPILLQRMLTDWTQDMTLLHTINHPSRLHDVKFYQPLNSTDEFLLVAAEDKKTTVYKFLEGLQEPPKIVAEMVGHLNRRVKKTYSKHACLITTEFRVKAIDTLRITLPKPSTSFTSTTPATTTTIACTVSSDGKIHVYDLAQLRDASNELPSEPQKIEPVASYDTKGTRLTCVTLADGDSSTAGQGKRKQEDIEHEGDEEGDDRPRKNAR
jgi:protein MAK11